MLLLLGDLPLSSDLVFLALQVHVLIVCLHLHLLHFALQFTVGLLQVVVVSERQSAITSLMQLQPSITYLRQSWTLMRCSPLLFLQPFLQFLDAAVQLGDE